MSFNSQPKLTLYRGLPNKGTYTLSPFVTKVEARLRFAGKPYTVSTGSLSAAPRGKVPYIDINIDDSDDGTTTTIPDSELIIKSLVEDGYLPAINDIENLSPSEKANDIAVRGLLEDRLYFIMVNSSFFTF